MKIIDCTKDSCCYLESKRVSGSVEWGKLPDLMSADIYNYLVVTVSLYAHEQLEAYKSYSFFINGWATLKSG